MVMCKFPEVMVQLTGKDGNAFAILGVVTRGLRENGHSDSVDEFRNEATSSDYDHLLQTCMAYVNVE